MRSIEESSDERLEIDATFVMASCSKLMTTVAALQCVERGSLSLDEDISRILPELKHRDILTGFDPKTDKPILIPSTKAMTLRFVRLPFSTGNYNAMSRIAQKFL
jgi:hypothetical protein